MIKSKLQNISAALLLTVALAAPLSLNAQDTTTSGSAAPAAAATATPKAKKAKSTPPINGNVSAVDKTAKTFTVGSHTFTVADSTKFQGGTFDDLAVGTKVSVKYTVDGANNDATSVKISKAKTK
jgi:hypothetical protein